MKLKYVLIIILLLVSVNNASAGIYSGEKLFTIINELNVSRIREPFYWNITDINFATSDPKTEILINDTSDDSIVPFDVIDYGVTWAYIVYTESFNKYEEKEYKVRYNNPDPLTIDYISITGWGTGVGATYGAWGGTSFWSNLPGANAWHINTTSDIGVEAYIDDGGVVEYYRAKPMAPFRRDFTCVYNSTDNSTFRNMFVPYGDVTDAVGVLTHDGRVMKIIQCTRAAASMAGHYNTFKFYYNSDYVDQNTTQKGGIPNDHYGIRYSCVGIDTGTKYADRWVVNTNTWDIFNPGGVVENVLTMSEPWMGYRGHDTYVSHNLLMVTVWNNTYYTNGVIIDGQSEKNCSGDECFHIGMRYPPLTYNIDGPSDLRFIDINITENKTNCRREFLKYNSDLNITLYSTGPPPTPTPTPLTYTNYTALFDNLFTDLSVWGFLSAIFGTYELMCGGSLFWLIIILIPFIMSWIKTQSVIIPSVLALITGSTLFVLIPAEAIGTVKILIMIGIAGLLYHIIKSR